MKPKVILDIAYLGHSHDRQSVRRGTERVASHLFCGLIESGQCKLSFAATSYLAGAFDFLAARGIPPVNNLRFSPVQLRASRFGRRLSKIVHRNLENRSLPARAARRMLAAAASICTIGELRLTPAMLQCADIYHSVNTPFPSAVKAQRGIKKFITLHDFMPLTAPEYFSAGHRRFMDRLLDSLTPETFAFCISEATRNDALNFSRLRPENIFVTPLAADQIFFHQVTSPETITAVRTRCRVPAGPYFLALSAHDRHKNFPHLIHCFGALIEAGELLDTSLVIVGPHPERNPEVAGALAKYPRARSRIIIAGFVPDENLAALYSGATAFLFPSLMEGFGIPPLEAMQCGTPVIASNITSIPEVVGDAGILLPPTNRDAWCQAMLQVSRRESLRAELRQKSLARCRLFSWPRFIGETLRGYRKSLEMK